MRLRERGHHIVFLASEFYEPLMKQLGIELVATSSREDQLQITASPNLTRPFGAVREVGRGFMLGPAKREYAAIRDLYEPGNTVLIGKGRNIGARIAMEKLGVPMATLVLSPDWLRSIYGSGPQVSRNLPKPARKWLQSVFHRRVNSMMMPETNRLREELGLPALPGLFDDWIFSPQLMLGLFPEWFAPPRPDWPKVRLTGFPLIESPHAQELPGKVEDFLGAGEPPWIVSALSGMQAAGEFFERSVAALRRIGARGILLSPFPSNVPANLPQGIRYFGYVPHRLLLPKAAGIIHQGGTGTIAGALLAGIPQLVVPVNLIDGPPNGRRIAIMGVGAHLMRFRYRPRRVAREIEKLLSSSTVKERCYEYATKMKGQDGIGESCRVIEEVYCETRTNASRSSEIGNRPPAG